mgnify:CR=1 FL=1
MGAGMKFEDVMSAAEAAERWGISPVTVKQACSGQRNTPPRFTNSECRKSKGTWLVTKQGMERLYGEEIKVLKVINCTSNLHQVMGTVGSYKEAWEMIYDREMKQSPCIGKWDKAQWEECDMQDEFPDFKWPEGVDYVWTADWIAEVILDPKEYNEEGVRGLIDDLMLSYKIEEIAD